MLFLLFQLDQDRYALEASRVIEIIPLLNLKPLPQAPKGIAGMIIYRGHPIPVLDLCQMRCGRPARAHLSTRIIIIQTRTPQSEKQEAGRTELGDSKETGTPLSEAQLSTFPISAFPLTPAAPAPWHYTPADDWIGLIAERATETIRRHPHEFVPAGLGPLGRDGEPAGGKRTADRDTGLAGDAPPSVHQRHTGPAPALLLDKVLVDTRGVIQLLNPQNLVGENLRDLTKIKWHTHNDGPTENQTELFKT